MHSHCHITRIIIYARFDRFRQAHMLLSLHENARMNVGQTLTFSVNSIETFSQKLRRFYTRPSAEHVNKEFLSLLGIRSRSPLPIWPAPGWRVRSSLLHVVTTNPFYFKVTLRQELLLSNYCCVHNSKIITDISYIQPILR